MTIPINNRIVLIIGPTTSGKSTMAKKIQDQFQGSSVIVSHDEVFYQVNQNQSQSAIELEFRLFYISSILEAISDHQNQLVIIDGINLAYKNVLDILNQLQEIGYKDRITLLKTDLPIDLHLLFCEQRDDERFRRE
ncbi:MAG: ATP-binding protein, partial [Bacilli bacterium]|nr:ATP-binding protein [Bacilli bacterium]